MRNFVLRGNGNEIKLEACVLNFEIIGNNNSILLTHFPCKLCITGRNNQIQSATENLALQNIVTLENIPMQQSFIPNANVPMEIFEEGRFNDHISRKRNSIMIPQTNENIDPNRPHNFQNPYQSSFSSLPAFSNSPMESGQNIASGALFKNALQSTELGHFSIPVRRQSAVAHPQPAHQNNMHYSPPNQSNILLRSNSSIDENFSTPPQNAANPFGSRFANRNERILPLNNNINSENPSAEYWDEHNINIEEFNSIGSLPGSSETTERRTRLTERVDVLRQRQNGSLRSQIRRTTTPVVINLNAYVSSAYHHDNDDEVLIVNCEQIQIRKGLIASLNTTHYKLNPQNEEEKYHYISLFCI
jgi:hypothetical protein